MEEHQELVEGGTTRKPSSHLLHGLLALNVILLVVVLVYAVKIYNSDSSSSSPLSCVPDPNDPSSCMLNLGLEKDATREYYTSGQYDMELWALAGAWSSYWATQTVTPKATVVYDIDDTLLSNMPSILATDFGFIPKLWNAWVNSSEAPVLNQTHELYNQMLRQGYQIVLITGRQDVSTQATRDNLAWQNITGYSKLILRAPNEYSMTATQYKSQRRQSLQQSGAYNIVGCIGDQVSDCAGGYAGYIMKVPNLAYFIS